MTRQTSIEAYHQIKNEGLLSERRMQVYDILYEHGPMTLAQLNNIATTKMGHPINSGNFGTRLSELRNFGVVRELGKTICPLTGRKALLWDVTDGLPAKCNKKSTDIYVNIGRKPIFIITEFSADPNGGSAKHETSHCIMPGYGIDLSIVGLKKKKFTENTKF